MLLQDTWNWLTDQSHWTGDGGILPLAESHFKITLYSVLIAAGIGLSLGIVLGHLRRGGPVVTILANLGRAVPVLGLLTILAAYNAIGVTTKAAVIALAVFAIPPVLTNTWTGMTGVDQETVEAAKGLGMSGRQVLFGVELPLALPLIAAGIRTAVLQVFATATIASYVGSTTLGNLIYDGQNNGQQGQREVLGGAFLIALFAVLLDLLLGAVQALLTPGPAGERWRRVFVSLRPFRRRVELS